MPKDMTTMAEYLANAVAKWPGKAAVVAEGQELTYSQLDDASARLAGHLRDRAGVGPGTRVGIALRNRPEALVSYWATQRLGAAVLPINYRLGHEALAHIIQEAELAALVLDSAGWEALSPVLETLPASARPHLVLTDTPADDAVSWDEALGAPRPQLSDDAARPEAPAVLLYTSGTTGLPKGAVMRHQDLVFNVKMAIVAQSLRHEDRHLLALPFFVPTVCYTLINTSAYLGSTLVLAPDPEPGTVLPLLADQRCTTFFGVPTMFFFLTQHPRVSDYDLRALRLIAYSGSPMPVRTIRRLRELLPGVWLHNFFGLTETIAMTHVLPSADADRKPESIGKLLPEIDARVVRDDGTEAGPGEVGELQFARDIIISEYFKRPGLLEESLREGWFCTGDLASVDEEGYFYVHGRSKDMVIVAGQNVYTLEVEQVIMRMEQVREVAVVGVSATGVRAALGELVKAVVVPHPGEELTERDVKRHCAQHLPSYKGPHIVEFRDELPRNAAGKVLKRLLVD